MHVTIVLYLLMTFEPQTAGRMLEAEQLGLQADVMGAAAEVDAIGEQQLKWTQSENSS